MDLDTIAAIATPVGRGGIGIIRISGPQALTIAQGLFSPFRRSAQSSGSKSKVAVSQRLTYGLIHDPQNNQTIDEALLAVMRAPHSYTREDVVEIQSHGGPVILDKLLTLVLSHGARLAQPGEFTRRAFLNGRIDLSQAEAVADLINANSESARAAATYQLEGSLRRAIEQMIDILMDIRMRIEADIEFPDQVSITSEQDTLIQRLHETIIPPIEQLIAGFANGRLLREGVRLAIVGRPNVGKSSLLNALIEKQRAIVTPFPGTTRDMIEEALTINGLSVILADTAGLHDSTDPIEILGIHKTHQAIESADFVLFMIEAGQDPLPADLMIYETIALKKVFVVINKIDLLENPLTARAPHIFQQHPWRAISVLKGTGIAELKAQIVSVCLTGDALLPQKLIVTNIRHKQCLEEALSAIRQAVQSLAARMPEDLISLDFEQAITALKTIIGLNYDIDLLDRIFQQFCIGK